MTKYSRNRLITSFPVPSRQLTERLGELIFGCGRLSVDQEVAAEGFVQVLHEVP